MQPQPRYALDLELVLMNQMRIDLFIADSRIMLRCFIPSPWTHKSILVDPYREGHDDIQPFRP